MISLIIILPLYWLAVMALFDAMHGTAPANLSHKPTEREIPPQAANFPYLPTINIRPLDLSWLEIESVEPIKIEASLPIVEPQKPVVTLELPAPMPSLALPAPVIIKVEEPSIDTLPAYRQWETTSTNLKALLKDKSSVKMSLTDPYTLTNDYKTVSMTKEVKPQTAKVMDGLYNFKLLRDLVRLIPDESTILFKSHPGQPTKYSHRRIPPELVCSWSNHSESGKWTLIAGYNVGIYSLTKEGKGLHMTSASPITGDPMPDLQAVLGVEIF